MNKRSCRDFDNTSRVPFYYFEFWIFLCDLLLGYPGIGDELWHESTTSWAVHLGSKGTFAIVNGMCCLLSSSILFLLVCIIFYYIYYYWIFSLLLVYGNQNNPHMNLVTIITVYTIHMCFQYSRDLEKCTFLRINVKSID